MAAGIFGANLSLTLAGGSKSVNNVLGGTNTYEKIIITATKLTANDGVLHIGGSNVSASIFGGMLKTGETKELYMGHIASSTINLGANLFFFNPTADSIRLEIIGFSVA